MEKISIRHAKQEDLEKVIDLGHDMFVAEKAFEPRLTFDRNESLSHYMEELGNNDALIIVAETTGEIVGYQYSYITELDYLEGNIKECHLEAIYVEPEYRHHGIAEVMMDKTEEWARQRGAKRMKAGIYNDNVASRKLHEKHGFSEYYVEYTKPLD